jgi:hypothetical protein
LQDQVHLIGLGQTLNQAQAKGGFLLMAAGQNAGPGDLFGYLQQAAAAEGTGTVAQLDFIPRPQPQHGT